MAQYINKDTYVGDTGKQLKDLLLPYGDTLPIGAIVNYNGTTVPEGYESVGNDYSTTEVNTGKTWIDGKPIYRKVINSVLNGTYIESGYRFTWINAGVNNINVIKDVGGLIIYPDRISPIGKDGNSSICYRNGQGIQIGANEGMHPHNTQCSVWIEYTKTTD